MRYIGQPFDLRIARLRVIVGVVPNEHLEKVRVELFHVLGKIVAVFEFEEFGPALLDGHRQDEVIDLRLSRHVGAEVLIDEDSCSTENESFGRGETGPLVDDLLGAAHRFYLGFAGHAFHAEECSTERLAMIHRQHEQRRCRRRLETAGIRHIFHSARIYREHQ